jgi:hypothetical protein
MRTTLTIEDDVAAMIRRIQKRDQKPFKVVVNDLLRKGLVESSQQAEEHRHYSTPELSSGPCRFADLDNISEILAVAEREDYS